MHAYVLHNVDDLRYEEVETPVPQEGEVLLHVKAAGICGSDIPRVYQTGAHVMPLIIGHEFSGIVEKVGPGVSEKWTGQRTGVFPLIPCMECEPCRHQQYEMCHNYNYLGSRCNGGFAEYCVVPAQNLLPIPDQVTYDQAAMMEPMAVAVHAIRGLGVTKKDHDQWTVVCGLGTIGLLVVMFLKELGLPNVIAIGNKDLQKAMAEQLGIDDAHFINSKEEDPAARIQEITDQHGADIFFECVGRNETINLSMEAAASAGRIMLVGNPATNMSFCRDTYWKILRKELIIRGTWNSSFLDLSKNKCQFQFEDDVIDDWHYVLSRLSNGSIHPEQLITHHFYGADLMQGFEIMHRRSEAFVKIMYFQ